MYRLKEIQDKLLHVVGWNQSYNPVDAINTNLIETESGLYFQGAHPLLTLDNIRAILPEEFIMQYPDWNMIVEYEAGDKVKHNSKVYIANTANVNVEPLQSDFNEDFNDDFGAIWQLYNFLSDYLERETRNGIAAVVQNFITMKQLDKETRNLLESRTFFDGSGRLAATIENKGKICGYEIDLVRSMGVTVKINRIGLQMTGATGMVRMYLFNSNRVDPYATIDLNYTLANGGFQWFEVDNMFLPYISEDTNAGGSWYLCYNQNDLPDGMEAITVSKDWSREPCGGCNIGTVQSWREITKYVSVSPFVFKAPVDFDEFPELWNIEKNIYTNTTNYGINVEFSVGCDLTDFIISQRGIFANVIQKQVAANLLRTIAMNPDVRVNRNQSNVSRMEILYELDGNTASERPNGLGHRLYLDYKALKMDTRGIDRICLTCNNKGVRYNSI